MKSLTCFLELVFLELAFPDDDYMPPLTLELLGHALVTGLVAVELRLPELDVRFGGCGVFAPFVVVPETPMYEYRYLAARKGDVRMPDALLPVAAIATPAHFAEHVTYHELGLGVDAFIRDH